MQISIFLFVQIMQEAAATQKELLAAETAKVIIVFCLFVLLVLLVSSQRANPISFL